MTTTLTLDDTTTYKFAPRGLGSSWDACFICNEDPLGDGLGEGSCHENLAAFVASRGEGEIIVALFRELGLTATPDFRDAEPNWIQVKLGACRAHQPSLRLLYRMTSINDDISLNTIRYCLPLPRVERDTPAYREHLREQLASLTDQS